MRKGTGKKIVKATAPATATEGGPPEFVASSLRIEKSIHDRLRKLAFDTRMPMQTYVNRGIEMVLKAEKY
ncbi:MULTISPECIES: hypothetical protein [Acidobacteriaceae]|uniref:hypothetical protein n=1 Tax=Acidobacteriaceae TaxID=204434 RepID=UPI00131BCAF0|nr:MULTISPECIES: hypothetical protein [Acidobacteriaceae]MDW5266933.1 hypothetical protein [Edaphobacter sp.]